MTNYELAPDLAIVPGALAYSLNGSGKAVPASATDPVPVSVAGVTVSMDATATAAAPSYVEGTANPLSQTLTGNQRVTGVGGTFPVTGTFWQATQPVSIATAPVLVAGSAIIGKVGVDQTTPGTTNAVSLAQVGATTVLGGAGTVGSGAQRVVESGAATGTLSTVASSATSVTILAANASRMGAAVYNDSTQILYLGFSATTASTTAYSVQVPPSGYVEVPSKYNGQLTGIWASANGNARVTEIS